MHKTTINQVFSQINLDNVMIYSILQKLMKKNVVLILIILFVGIVGGTYWYIQDKFGKMQQVDIDEATLNISSEVEKSLSGYRNIAIFGVDSRDSNLGKGNRSDCMIIASLDQKTKNIRLISVYRDT